MEVMDALRLELYDLLKPKLDEELARKLVLALPADPRELATRSDLQGTREHFDVKLANMREHFDVKLAEHEARIVDKVTWRMIAVMGGWTITATAMFTYLAELFR